MEKSVLILTTCPKIPCLFNHNGRFQIISDYFKLKKSEELDGEYFNLYLKTTDYEKIEDKEWYIETDKITKSNKLFQNVGSEILLNDSLHKSKDVFKIYATNNREIDKPILNILYLENWLKSEDLIDIENIEKFSENTEYLIKEYKLSIDIFANKLILTGVIDDKTVQLVKIYQKFFYVMFPDFPLNFVNLKMIKEFQEYLDPNSLKRS